MAYAAYAECPRPIAPFQAPVAPVTVFAGREGDIVRLAGVNAPGLYRIVKAEHLGGLGPVSATLELEPWEPDVHVDWTMTASEWEQLSGALVRVTEIWPLTYPYVAEMRDAGKLASRR